MHGRLKLQPSMTLNLILHTKVGPNFKAYYMLKELTNSNMHKHTKQALDQLDS